MHAAELTKHWAGYLCHIKRLPERAQIAIYNSCSYSHAADLVPSWADKGQLLKAAITNATKAVIISVHRELQGGDS